jgi:hypothetical protein
MKKKKEEKLVSNKPLKLDRAMKQAEKRAQYQPKIISILSKVREFGK